MSGGPLVDQCGSLVGVNTMGLAGLSLFITAFRNTPVYTGDELNADMSSS